jgi:hypothetical protein
MLGAFDFTQTPISPDPLQPRDCPETPIENVPENPSA